MQGKRNPQNFCTAINKLTFDEVEDWPDRDAEVDGVVLLRQGRRAVGGVGVLWGDHVLTRLQHKATRHRCAASSLWVV